MPHAGYFECNTVTKIKEFLYCFQNSVSFKEFEEWWEPCMIYLQWRRAKTYFYLYIYHQITWKNHL